MNTVLRLATAALIAGACISAFGQPGIHPEEAIPDNLPRLASPGPYDDFVKEVQEKLHERGFDAGPVNGDFGEKTQAALAQFQLANLLPASGMLDDKTLLALGVQRPAESTQASAASDGGDAAAGSTR